MIAMRSMIQAMTMRNPMTRVAMKMKMRTMEMMMMMKKRRKRRVMNVRNQLR